MFVCFFLKEKTAFAKHKDGSIRIVSQNEKNCTYGRLEIYDGKEWGSFSDCKGEFKTQYADLICGFNMQLKCKIKIKLNI